MKVLLTGDRPVAATGISNPLVNEANSSWRMKRHSIIAIFWLLLSLYIAYASYQLGLGTGGKPGAGFFPFGTALAIGAIALLRLSGVSHEQSDTKTSDQH